MPAIPANVYPAEITFDDRFSQKDRGYYYALVSITAYRYYLALKDHDLWRTPYRVSIEVGSGEGLATHNYVRVKMPHNPGLLQKFALSQQVGHEFAHMLYARLMYEDRPEYGWGGGEKDHINAVHFADGIHKFDGNHEYIKSKYVINWKKLRIMRIVAFDLLRLRQDRERVVAHVAAHQGDPRWHYSG